MQVESDYSSCKALNWWIMYRLRILKHWWWHKVVTSLCAQIVFEALKRKVFQVSQDVNEQCIPSKTFLRGCSSALAATATPKVNVD